MDSFEKKVGKFRNLFESSKKILAQPASKPVEIKRRSRLISNELLNKFDDPGMAEQLREQREAEREERRIKRLQKLEEERLKQEETARESQRLEEER